MTRWIYAVPVAAFAVLAFFLFRSLTMPAPDLLPSPLIDRPVPDVRLPPMDAATPGFSRADLTAGHVTVVNFFASTCAPCVIESPQLQALARQGVALYGVDYLDQPAAGRAFLNQYGDPFSRIVADQHGQQAIDWGVYGTPETYVIDGKGIVRFKLVGALTQSALTGQVLPAIRQAREANPGKAS